MLRVARVEVSGESIRYVPCGSPAAEATREKIDAKLANLQALESMNNVK